MALELTDELLMPPVAEEFHDLHKRTMKQIEADLSRWNQSDWAQLPYAYEDLNIEVEEDVFIYDTRCDTQYCYAGHALVLAGYRIALDTRGDLIALELKGNEWVPVEEGIHQLTEDILGITPHQASCLYDTGHEDIKVFKAEMSELFGIDYD
jgi:hypothetical protein